MIRRSLLLGLLSAVLTLVDAGSASAQERVRLDGWVQWVAASNMQVMTGAGTVAIDLRQADQSSYQGLRAGDRVIVDGTVAPDRRSVIASGIWSTGYSAESP